MLDPRLLRTDAAQVALQLARRGFVLDVAALVALEEQRKAAQIEADGLRAERNANAKAVGMTKGKGEDPAALMQFGESLAAHLQKSEQRLAAIQQQLTNVQMDCEHPAQQRA